MINPFNPYIDFICFLWEGFNQISEQIDIKYIDDNFFFSNFKHTLTSLVNI